MTAAGKTVAKGLLAAILLICAIVGSIYFAMRLVFGAGSR